MAMAKIRAFRELVLPLMAIIGSVGSVLGLVFPLLNQTDHIEWWMIALLVIFALLTLLSIFILLRTRRGCRAYAVDDRSGIRDYMRQWLEDGRRSAIWTRDMSWAEHSDIEDLLARKAISNDLIICLPQGTELTDRLKQSGAEVFLYGALGSPATSFTIVNYERDGSRVAVGSRRGDVHLIQEFVADDSPVFHMAEDIVRLAMHERRSER